MVADEPGSLVSAGIVGKVRYEDQSLGIRYVELSNGVVIGLACSDDPGQQPLDVVLHDSETNACRPVPAALWRNESWIGTVKGVTIRGDFLVDRAGVISVQTAEGVDPRIGNTVLCELDRGIVEVLSAQPVKLFDIGELDDSDVARFREDGKTRIRFDDIGGLSAAIEMVNRLVILPLARRNLLEQTRARAIKGALFTGEPGTGKTMLARAIADESDAQFYNISGPEILSKWQGHSEELLRKIFEDAERRAPSVILFDEIDSIGSSREGSFSDSSNRMVTTLLSLMDGFRPHVGVIVIATTNRANDIDPALLRPGRFDWKIEFPVPDELARKDILQKSSARHNTYGELPLVVLAKRAVGWSGAELAAVWPEAALAAVEDGRGFIAAEDLEIGFSRVLRDRASALADKRKNTK